MTILFIFIGFIAILFIIRLFFVGRVPLYRGISFSGLTQYLAYLLEKALADEGTVHVEAEGNQTAINILKRLYLKKPAKIFITLSAGYIPRANLVMLAKKFERNGILFKTRYTNYYHKLNRVIIEIPFGDHPATDVLSIFRTILHELGIDEMPTFTVSVYGPLNQGFVYEDGDVVKHPTGFVIGKALGFFVGRIVRFLNGY
ncbi:MAG: hypothetical protein WDA22_07715 [Bacteroidota bacterium]